MIATVTDSKPSLHWSVRLRSELQQKEPLGSFAYKTILADVPSMNQHVTIEGIGRLGFPMLGMVVDAMIAVSTKAPFGRHDKTLYDDAIRTAWQIDASKIAIKDKETWTTYFSEQVQQCCFQLGISNERFETSDIKANLYKMLIYETGEQLAPNRYDEKEVGVLGTLIIQFPTSEGFTGGVLTVTHGDESKTINMSIGNDEEFHAVAFYADCDHQFHPITRGKRVCLVYNLVAVLQENTRIPSHVLNIDTELNLRLILEEWKSRAKMIKKIGYQLLHRYKNRSIGFSTLKGRDKIALATLRTAKDCNGARLFHVSILLMSHYCEQNSFADHGKHYLNPFILIEENIDGSIDETMVKNDKEVGTWQAIQGVDGG
jgi:hypothetical protein